MGVVWLTGFCENRFCFVSDNRASFPPHLWQQTLNMNKKWLFEWRNHEEPIFIVSMDNQTHLKIRMLLSLRFWAILNLHVISALEGLPVFHMVYYFCSWNLLNKNLQVQFLACLAGKFHTAFVLLQYCYCPSYLDSYPQTVTAQSSMSAFYSLSVEQRQDLSPDEIWD